MVYERVKKNFDETAPTGKKISDLLPQILSSMNPRGHNERAEIFQFWFSLMGAQGSLTVPVSWKNGVLTIKVKSATLYALLCQHEKPRLLMALKTKFNIETLSLKIG